VNGGQYAYCRGKKRIEKTPPAALAFVPLGNGAGYNATRRELGTGIMARPCYFSDNRERLTRSGVELGRGGMSCPLHQKSGCAPEAPCSYPRDCTQKVEIEPAEERPYVRRNTSNRGLSRSACVESSGERVYSTDTWGVSFFGVSFFFLSSIHPFCPVPLVLLVIFLFFWGC
jgi:hypothetical protein